MNIFDKTFFRFVIVGFLNTIVGSVIMFCFYNLLNLNYWISSASNYVFGSILSFFLNKYFTFRVKEWNFFMIFSFILNILVCYGIAYGIAKPAMHYLLKDYQLKIRENSSLFIGMCLFTVLNFTGQKSFVFKKVNINNIKGININEK